MTAQASVADRRSHERIPFTVVVSLTSEHNFYTGFTQDISEGGVFIATNCLEPVGAIREFELSVGAGKGKVTAQGEVRWVREANDFSDVPPGMGIRFLDLHPEIERRINQFIGRKREALFFDDDF